MTTDKYFIGTAAVCGVLALPFSTTAALIALSVPTAYYGLGTATRALGAALSHGKSSGPAPS